MLFNKLLTSSFRFNLMELTTRSIYTLQNMARLTIPAYAVAPSTQLQIMGQNSSFLRPFNFIYNQVAGFKVKGRLRRRCKDCYFVMRQQRLYVICETHPRHKQMAMKAKDKKSWTLTHATQSKIRPY